MDKKTARLLRELARRGIKPLMGGADVKEIDVVTFTANVTLTTTTETVVATGGAINIPTDTALAACFAWAQLTTGVGTTTVTPRIRRGTAITDTLIGEANAEAIKAAAGSIEPFFAMVSEFFSLRGSVQYVFTLQQTAATGDGTALQGGIVTLIL